MSKNSELKSFKNRFAEEIFEVTAVTASLGVGAGKAGGEELWRASLNLIAWKDLNSGEPVVKEEVNLAWLTDDEGLKEWQKKIKESSVIKLKLRKGERYLGHCIIVSGNISGSLDSAEIAG